MWTRWMWERTHLDANYVEAARTEAVAPRSGRGGSTPTPEEKRMLTANGTEGFMGLGSDGVTVIVRMI